MMLLFCPTSCGRKQGDYVWYLRFKENSLIMDVRVAGLDHIMDHHAGLMI